MINAENNLMHLQFVLAKVALSSDLFPDFLLSVGTKTHWTHTITTTVDLHDMAKQMQFVEFV